MNSLKLTPADIYSKRVTIDPTEAKVAEGARIEVEILRYLWDRRGTRLETSQIAAGINRPRQTALRCLKRLCEDEIIRRKQTHKLGGKSLWWME